MLTVLFILIGLLCLATGFLFWYKRKYGLNSIKEFTIDKCLYDLRKSSAKQTLKNNRARRLKAKKSKLKEGYRTVVQAMLDNFDSTDTIEWVTFSIAGIALILSVVMLIVLKSVAITLVTVFAIVSAGLTGLASAGKKKASVKQNAVLDATDIICAYAEQGITYAIEDNLSNFSPVVKPYFMEFLDSRKNGRVFNKAMDKLNKQLGPAFSNFSKKAKVFDREQKKGMEQIFKDITEDNANIRMLNLQKDRDFGEINMEFLEKSIMLVGFIAFILSSNEAFKGFIMNTTAGKCVIAVAFAVECVAYAVTQLVQVDSFEGGGED